MSERLRGRVAIVTGAARGQGEAIARAFVDEGARVVCTDVLEEEGNVVAKDLADAGAFIRGDVSSVDDWAAAVALALERFGAVDVLVNNAAITQMGPLEQVTLEEHDRVVAINQRGVFLGMQAVFPSMRDQGRGVIINTSSGAAVNPPAGMSVYTATKAAVLALTRVAAFEWGQLGIRVNAILPGAIDTPMMRGDHTADVDFSAFFVDQPVSRPGRVEEIAATAVFLASDESSFITGTHILVDGGRHAAHGTPRKPG